MSLNEITVSKTELLSTLQDNRRKHKKEFQDSLKGWREEVKEALEAALSDVDDKEKEPKTYFDLPKPEDHTEEYDDVIELLKMSQDKQLKITSSEHRQYVLDKWQWKDHWSASNTAYMAKAQAMR